MLELRDNQNERKWNSRKLFICTAFQKANLPAIKEMNSLEFLLSPSGNTALQFDRTQENYSCRRGTGHQQKTAKGLLSSGCHVYKLHTTSN